MDYLLHDVSEDHLGVLGLAEWPVSQEVRVHCYKVQDLLRILVQIAQYELLVNFDRVDIEWLRLCLELLSIVLELEKRLLPCKARVR